MTKNIIKDTPFGYKTSKEFFNKIITPKFEKLTHHDVDSDMFELYYDFIFAAGALRDWIIHEFNFTTSQKEKYFFEDKYFNILRSIYNNTKHYELDAGKRKYEVLFDVLSDSKSLFPTDELGNCIWDDTIVWDNDASWDEKIMGESGNFNYRCTIIDYATKNTECIYIFEICKQVYRNYQSIIDELYTN